MTVIFAYTRAEALADGVLIDVTRLAREAGIRYPVALTSAVWAEYVRVPEGVSGQDEDGRLWDVLWMFRCAALTSEGTRLTYTLCVRNEESRLEQVTLKAECHPGDNGEPVVTIMLPHED